MPDVTTAIRDDLEWLIADQVYRSGANPCYLSDGSSYQLLNSHNWSPEMQAAISHLADLRAGRIKCWKD